MSRGTPILSLLYLTRNESNAVGSYASPRSPIMTITSTSIAAPITVTPILEIAPRHGVR